MPHLLRFISIIVYKGKLSHYNIMTKYFCHICQYDAKQKSNYTKHLKTKKHILFSSMTENVSSTTITSDEKDTDDMQHSMF